MTSILKTLRAATEGVAVAAFLVLLVVLLAQVFVRYVLRIPWFWSEEFVRFALVWVVMIGAGVTTHYREHIRVDLIDRYLSPGLRRLRNLVVDGLSLIFLGFLFWYGVEFVQRGAIAVTPAMGVPRSWVYASIPVGCVLMMMFLVTNIILDLRRRDGDG